MIEPQLAATEESGNGNPAPYRITLVLGLYSGAARRMLRRGGQREVEGGSAIDGRFRPDLTAMAMNDALNGRQPDAGAWELRLRMQPLEGTEQFAGVLRIETGAIVAHVVHVAPLAIRASSEGDMRLLARAREFPRVGQEIRERKPQQTRIALDLDSLGDHAFDTALRSTCAQLLHDLLRKLPQIHNSRVQRRVRSEERRVGKECRCRWPAEH